MGILHQFYLPRGLHELFALRSDVDEAVALYFLSEQMGNQTLVHHCQPVLFVLLRSGSEEREFVVAVALDKGIRLSCEDAGQMLHLEVLGQAQDELHHQQQVLASVEGSTRMLAVVA